MGQAKQLAPGIATATMGNVRMTVRREFRLRHVSDSPGEDGVAFGGDQMGQWNVSRVHRILDAMMAPIVVMPIDVPTMRNMARVGDPDMALVGRYVAMGRRSMPPLTFVSLADPSDPDTLQTMLVDGHHRMMALAIIGVGGAPARILPPTLADDVRIVEMGEVAIFPPPQAMNEVELQPVRHG